MPEEKEKSPLDSLAAKARLVGIDVSAIKAELVKEVAAELRGQSLEINTVDIEARLARKVVDSLENVSSKLTAAVEDVRKDLLGKLATMEQAVQPLVSQVVQAQIPAMCQTIAGQLEENIRKNPPQGGNNAGLGAIAKQLPPEFWANLASNLFAKKSNFDAGQAIRWLKIGQSLKVGGTQIEDIERALQSKE